MPLCHTLMSMAPAAPPGKPRCWVSEGVWCLKVYDIISGPDRWQGSGVPRPAEAGFFLHYICICMYIYIYIYMYVHTHTHTHIHT